MKISFTFILLSLLCSSALSATASVTVSGVTYAIENVGNDCGVSRTEAGSVTSTWSYTFGASSGVCVGKNIFAIGSNIWVVLSLNGNNDILNSGNTVTGDTTQVNHMSFGGNGIVIATIDTSSVQGTFGKFSYGISDVSMDSTHNYPTPLTYVSAVACDDQKTFQLTVNVQSPNDMINFPSYSYVSINGNGVKQVYNTDDKSLTAYTAAGAPFCTQVSTTEKSSGIAAWKLALIIALPCVAVLIVMTIFLYFKTARKVAAAKTEQFKQLPSSPTVVTGAENQV